jgi:hypothetical protein
VFRVTQFIVGAAGVALGVWQIIVIATLIWPAWGLLGLVVGYLVFPLTLLWAPLYSGLALGDWSYLWFYPASVVTYGLNAYVRSRSRQRG